MDQRIIKLIEIARPLVGEISLRDDCNAGTVAAAILTRSGNIYTGICVHLVCGIGFCAEHAAVAEMLKARETEIRAIVAVSARGVLPPCGRCRELLLQISDRNTDTLVAVNDSESMPLKDLIPKHWLVR
jgi:cytidine deaminase